MEIVRIRDGKKLDPGSGINIPDPPHYFYLQRLRPESLVIRSRIIFLLNS
jgi:hypothetical protein